MNITIEAFLRALALFLGVFFTTGWSMKSVPAWDTPLMVISVVLGLVASFLSGRQIKANIPTMN